MANTLAMDGLYLRENRYTNQISFATACCHHYSVAPSYIYSCCNLTVSVTVKVCGQAVQYPHFQNYDFVKPMPGIELTSTFKSNSLGFDKLSPCKCGSYLSMYSAYYTFGLINGIFCLNTCSLRRYRPRLS